MHIKLILMEPKYQVNLGYIARTAMNFGVGKLYLINPRARPDGKQARMYAKHAYRLLEGAKICKTLDEASRDCDLLLGTTGIRQKAKASFRRIYFAEDAVARIRKMKSNATVGLLMGRDDTGLRGEEIEKCDMLAYIGTSPEYPVMNISHAIAVFLYLLRRGELRTHNEEGMREKKPDAREVRKLLSLFESMISRKSMRNRKAVLGAFRRMVRKSQPTEPELHALITALK
ncbi:MAG: TrmJ/YjtD family RNA methyltransferase [Candidatus Micrarchaeota archaeon]|nr:TrmJ/YjtD family RNA methyltransferase [Candidatus Micrarchaeota archaeon]